MVPLPLQIDDDWIRSREAIRIARFYYYVFMI